MKNCSSCRAELPEECSYKTCERCRERASIARRKRRRAGVCLACEKQKLPKIQICKDCYFKRRSRVATGTEKNAQFLKQLLEAQNHRCRLTGELLVEGDNASIDHIIPRSHKNYPGDHCLDNLAWTTKDINRVKTNFTQEEFVQICRNVLQHNDRQNIGVMGDEVRSWEF